VKYSVNHLILLATVSFGFLAAACGSGGGSITSAPAPTPTSGPYSASSLNGTYAFEMSGQDSGGFFARIGSFAANGSGAVTGGVEDVNSAAIPGHGEFTFTTGSYTIQSNGKGTMSLTDPTGTLQFSIVMTSTTGGLLTETDGIATASGNFTVQNTATFSSFPNSISGPYAFDFSGLDPSGAGESLVGQFTGNGGGGISGGVVDINDDFTPLGEQAITSASFIIDSTNGPTFGRGTATFTIGGSVLNFASYLVGANHIRLLRTDYPAASIGDAVAQTGTIPTSTSGLSGSFALILGGSSLSGADVRGGRLSLSGGTVSNIQMDDDDSSASGSGNSNPTQIPKGTISGATYTVDPSGDGRGTISFFDSSLKTFSFIFYLVSPTQAFIQDISTGITSDGSMQAQSGNPFTSSAAAGNWAFNWSGQSVNTKTGGFGEEDFVGQYTLGSTGSVSGAVDFTELSASSVVINGALTGTLTIAGDGTGRNSYQIVLATSPSATLNFSAYFIDPNTMLVVGTDTHRIITGTVVRNF